jgi:hypothetical protein
MRVSVMIEMLSKHAPSIEIFTLCAALLAAWTEAPVWLPKTLAVVVGGLALLLFAARGGRHALKSPEELDFTQNRTWLEYELAGQGTPPGYYILAFFGFLTIVLTGFQSAYATPAWAAFALGIVWGIVNREYPADQETDH